MPAMPLPLDAHAEMGASLHAVPSVMQLSAAFVGRAALMNAGAVSLLNAGSNYLPQTFPTYISFGLTVLPTLPSSLQ